jgi:hypothetical protein
MLHLNPKATERVGCIRRSRNTPFFIPCGAIDECKGGHSIIVPTRKAQATTHHVKPIQEKSPCIDVGSSPRGHKNLPTLPGYACYQAVSEANDLNACYASLTRSLHEGFDFFSVI